MNNLGLIFAWSAAQVTIFLIPSMLLHMRASRRSPATGAWTAALGLMFCVILSVSCLLPLPRPGGRSQALIHSPPGQMAAGRGDSNFAAAVSSDLRDQGPRTSSDGLIDVSRQLSHLGSLWGRLERQADLPAEGLRRRGRMFAVVAIVGVGLGLARLATGLWAIRLYRRRARPVDDRDLNALLEELRLAFAINRKVILLETRELCAPATGGWRHPFVLLPEDWRTWDELTRRAVLAHELAHIARSDYATGLVARLAAAIHFYHPLVHWLARRLQLQQELAADALGVLHGGGRVAYLLALSRLALRQDGRLPCWPARAFLPARGALIRRISMLESSSNVAERPWSLTSRMVSAACLLGMAMSIAMLRTPSRADEKGPAAQTAAPAAAIKSDAGLDREAIDWLYVPDRMDGLVMVRPAAAFRRFGKPGLASIIARTIALEFCAPFVAEPGFLLSPDQLPALSLENVEWITGGFRFGVHQPIKGEKEKLHTFELRGAAIRTVAPVDWLAFFRRCGIRLTEARAGTGTFYRIANGKNLEPAPEPCIYLPDNRTVVFESREAIEKLASSGRCEVPAYLKGKEWQNASKGILAFAFHNQPDFAKRYDLGRPDDRVVLSLLDGVDSWILGVDDADQIGIQAVGVTPRDDVQERIARLVESLVQQGQKELNGTNPDPAPTALQLDALRMMKGLLTNVQTRRAPGGLTIDSRGFGTLSQFAALIEPDLKDMDAQLAKEIAASQKRGGKAVTR
jgi:beta-lactamase regulating signal transducer with metallopeptidase domain